MTFVLKLTVGLLVFILGMLWIHKKPDKVFWLSLLLFMDPGGLFNGYLGGNIIARIKYYDLFAFLMIMAYLISRRREAAQTLMPDAKRFLNLLILIAIYYIFIYGYTVPVIKGYEDFAYFIQKNRQYFYSIPIYLSAYYFSIRSINIFYRYIIWFALFILGAYFITLLTTNDLIPVVTYSRYGEDDRISMISYGLINWVQPLGLVVLSFGQRVHLPKRQLLYAGMILMVVTTILTLTRRDFISMIYMILVIPFLISYVTNSSFVIKFRKYVFPILIAFTVLSLFFPNYINYASNLLVDTTSLIATGEDTRGLSDYRVTGTGDLRVVKKIIADDWLWGIGYYPAAWTDIVDMKKSNSPLARALDASAEVPIYGAIMRLGLIGLILPVSLFIFIFKIGLKIVRFLKKYFDKLVNYPLELCILITIIYYFLERFTVSFYDAFQSFIAPSAMAELCILLGLLQGIFKRIVSKINQSEVNTVLDMQTQNFR